MTYSKNVPESGALYYDLCNVLIISRKSYKQSGVIIPLIENISQNENRITGMRKTEAIHYSRRFCSGRTCHGMSLHDAPKKCRATPWRGRSESGFQLSGLYDCKKNEFLVSREFVIIMEEL
jgi:hypothetical protein